VRDQHFVDSQIGKSRIGEVRIREVRVRNFITVVGSQKAAGRLSRAGFRKLGVGIREVSIPQTP
jgi:hypothetical protein